MNIAMSSNSFTIVFCMLLPALYLACNEESSESKPEIQAFPSKVVKKGANVTVRCSSPNYWGRFQLKGDNTAWFYSEHDVYEEDFTVTNVQENNSTNYYCIQLTCGVQWSMGSDFLTLKVIDPGKPQISFLLDGSDNTQLLITCTAPEPPEGCRVKRFFLYSGKEEIRDLSAIDGSPNVTFTVSSLPAEYRCSYVLEVKEQPRHLIKSPHSLKKTPTIPEDEKEKTDTEHDKEIDRIDHDNATEDSNHAILIPVVATVCGFLTLILVVILVVYFIRKNKSSPQKMKTSEFPQSDQTDISTEVTYCTVDENRMTATPQVEVDMKDTTMDDYNDDGITYAKLNNVVLKQKNTQLYIPTDTSLYAEVKKS